MPDVELDGDIVLMTDAVEILVSGEVLNVGAVLEGLGTTIECVEMVELVEVVETLVVVKEVLVTTGPVVVDETVAVLLIVEYRLR